MSASLKGAEAAPKARFAGIDLLRNLLAIGVVLQHMHSPSRYSAHTELVLDEVIAYVDSAVIGFFMISGFLFKPPSDLISYGRRQIVRLLVPFLLFSLFNSVLLAALGKVPLQHDLSATLSLHGAGPQLYFLPMLLFATLLWAVLGIGLGRWPITLTLGSCVVLLAVSLLLPTVEATGPNYRLIPLYLLAFCIGYLLKISELRFLTTLIVIAICLALIAVDARFKEISIEVVLLVLALRLSAWLPAFRIPGSGGVYLLHTPILNFTISTLLQKSGVLQVENLTLSVVLTEILALVLTFTWIRAFPRYRWLLLE